MWPKPEHDQFVEELLLAGEKVPPGIYRQVGTGRIVVLEQEEILPATLDGHVACYVRVEYLWGATPPLDEKATGNLSGSR